MYKKYMFFMSIMTFMLPASNELVISKALVEDLILVLITLQGPLTVVQQEKLTKTNFGKPETDFKKRKWKKKPKFPIFQPQGRFKK